MTPGKYDLNLYRGDTYEFRVRLWSDEAGTVPVDLTGATALAQFRDKSGGAVVMNMATTITTPNTIDVLIGSVQWVGAPTAGSWDLQVTEADGNVMTPLAGKVTVTPDISGSV